jgi:hypothetical protein
MTRARIDPPDEPLMQYPDIIKKPLVHADVKNHPESVGGAQRSESTINHVSVTKDELPGTTTAATGVLIVTITATGWSHHIAS